MLRGTQAREETKLIIVALRLAPITVDRSDQRFGLLNREWIRGRAIFLRQAKALEHRRRVALPGMIAIAVLERAADDADDVVVGLLRDLQFRINDLRQRRILHLFEDQLADGGPPGRLQDLSIALHRRECEIRLRHARFVVHHELIEDLVASSRRFDGSECMEIAELRKLLSEHERSERDSALDLFKLDVRAPQVGLGWNALERGPVAPALILEVELDAIRSFGAHTNR
nr:hypothetical protein [Peristeroidobacter agariperforans]